MLDLKGTSGTLPRIEFENPDTMNNPWLIDVSDNDDFRISVDGTGVQELKVSNSGDLHAAGNITTNGQFGLGTTSPATPLHVLRSTGAVTTLLQLENDNGARIRFENSMNDTQDWLLTSNPHGFSISEEFSGGTEFLLDNAGNLTLRGTLTANGNVGIGPATPETRLHISETAAPVAERVLVTLANNGGAQLEFRDTTTGVEWETGSRNGNNDFEITRAGSGGVELLIDAVTNDVTIRGSIITSGGLCGDGCDKVFTQDHQLPTIAEHTDAMWSEGYLPNVDPTVENEPINVSEKLGRMLNELETAHVYIAELHAALQQKDQELADFQGRLAAIEARINVGLEN